MQSPCWRGAYRGIGGSQWETSRKPQGEGRLGTDSPLAVILAECIIAARKNETRGAVETKPIRKVYVIEAEEESANGNDSEKAA